MSPRWQVTSRYGSLAVGPTGSTSSSTSSTSATATAPSRLPWSEWEPSCSRATTTPSSKDRPVRLKTLSSDDLDRVVDRRFDPPVTLGVRLVSVVSDDLQHVGQAALCAVWSSLAASGLAARRPPARLSRA